MSRGTQEGALTGRRRWEYEFAGRRYELVKTPRGYQVVMDPPRPRLWRWCDWRLHPQPDAARAENALWCLVGAAMARHPHVQTAVIGDVPMVIVTDYRGYHVAVLRPGEPRAVDCGATWRDTIEICSGLVSELLDQRPHARRWIGPMRW
jgi:hypothetical protein